MIFLSNVNGSILFNLNLMFQNMEPIITLGRSAMELESVSFLSFLCFLFHGGALLAF